MLRCDGYRTENMSLSERAVDALIVRIANKSQQGNKGVGCMLAPNILHSLLFTGCFRPITPNLLSTSDCPRRF